MSKPRAITRVAALKTPADFRAYLEQLGVELQVDDEIVTEGSPLLEPLTWGERTIGNRWAVHPMEGWDGTATGGVTDPMIRRWLRFGDSGAKLIWGGEAMAVCEDGRANPNQLIITKDNEAGIASLRETLVSRHAELYGNTDDLVIGFQLTHSGRFCRPYDKKKLEPRIAYRHPILDRKFGIDGDDCVLTDDDIKRLIECYIEAARIAARAGADFVDIKHCHGYLLHEFLGAYTRPGPYGGSFENRTRILREIADGIRAAVPAMRIGVRLSAFDWVPFRPDPELTEGLKLGPGIPEDFSECLPYKYAFSLNPDNPIEAELSETIAFLELLQYLDIQLVNLSAGSPYYNPHIQRPALFPPSDGYQPCEDPLVGCARQINAVKTIKARFPKLIIVGSAYSYLQEYLPHAAQYYVRDGHVDSVGLGRMILTYPEILAHATSRGALEKKRICRTFSDCTTAPRNGLPSGCYPLDDYYKSTAEAAQLKAIKKRA